MSVLRVGLLLVIMLSSLCAFNLENWLEFNAFLLGSIVCLVIDSFVLAGLCRCEITIAACSFPGDRESSET